MQVSIQINATPPRWLASRRRRVVAAVGVAIALVVPGLALANHQFSDVPTASTFHTNVARVYGARITNGCAPDLYCPDDAVSRGQMAAFIARSAGRVETATMGFFTIGTDAAVIAGTVVIRAGDVPGGTANIVIRTDLGAYTYSAPSDAIYRIDIYHGASFVANTWVTMPGKATFDYAATNASLSQTVAVPTGVNQTFTVRVYKLYGTASLTGYGTLTASYAPFNGIGANAAIPAAVTSGASSGGDPAK